MYGEILMNLSGAVAFVTLCVVVPFLPFWAPGLF